MKEPLRKGSLFLTLLSSSSTLVCCTIPAIFVVLGAGSTVVALVGMFPQLICLSEHKPILFLLGAVMLAISGFMQWKQPASCPIDPVLAQSCRTVKYCSRWIWGISFVLYIIGFGVSYVLPLLMNE
ncbi:MAG: hypothetical protein EXS67_02295 [Candidatus Margulisbacteria bacterium]|nr:hypothetical protein [Candidatus Margulisiibacteriota bacterium]